MTEQKIVRGQIYIVPGLESIIGPPPPLEDDDCDEMESPDGCLSYCCGCCRRGGDCGCDCPACVAAVAAAH